MQRRYGFKHDQLRPFGMRISKPQPLVEAMMNGGIVTSIDPADIPNNNVQVARNMSIRMDKLGRRVGTLPLIEVPGYVKKFAAVKDKAGVVNKVIFVGNKVYDVSSGVAIEMVATPPLAALLNDRVRTAYILDKLVFTTNGADPIQLVDFAATTVAPLGNAPVYRYVTGMFNRVVGAARKGINESEVGWSAEYPNIQEWNPAVIETAGSSPIIDATNDLSDHITGIFSMANIGILLREKSIWGINKQPIPQNPFHFYSAFTGVGCDTPNSATRIRNGIGFLDRDTECVWSYSPNQAPIPIGEPVQKELVDMVTDPEAVFSAYSLIHDEYYLAIPLQGSLDVVVWVYHFKYKQWTSHIRSQLSSIDEVNMTTGGATIDQLGTTPIDELTGTIDSLSSTVVSTTKKIFGQETGNVSYEDESTDTDSFIDSEARSYESEAMSKVFTIPTHISTIYAIRIEYQMLILGTIELQLSRDNVNWVTVKSVTPTQVNVRLEMLHKKPIRTKHLAWRVVSSDGIWNLLGYSIEVQPSGDSKEINQ
jgi:hypothetical protein